MGPAFGSTLQRPPKASYGRFALRSLVHFAWIGAGLAGCSDDAAVVTTPEGPPGLHFVDVCTDRHDVVPCVDTLECHVPSSARVSLRLTANGATGLVTGLQWRLHRPNREPGPWEPFGSEDGWLDPRQDASANDDEGRQLWSMHADTLSVHFAASPHDTISSLGTLLFTARARLAEIGPLPLESQRALTIFASPLPWPVFLDVRVDEPGVLPCAEAAPCTIPALTPFRLRFTGASTHDWIRGFSWLAEPPLWEPFGSSEDPPFLPAGHDTVAVLEPDTLWSLSGDVVTVHARAVHQLTTGGWRFRYDVQPAGRFLFRARVRDDTGVIGSGERWLHLGYPPDTRLHGIPSCDCPHPVPGCEAAALTPLGWVTGIRGIHLREFPMTEWIPFCAGDTLPNGSRVRLYARGWDDPRDRPLQPGGPAEVQYRFRSESRRAEFESIYEPYSSPAVAALDLPLPDGGIFRGGSVEFGACPLDYVVEATAVDELGTLDYTPASIRFYVGGAPALDSLSVPPVLVCVPTCGPNADRCLSTPSPGAFGPDTLLVFGSYVADDPNTPRTPLAVGFNSFRLPFRAWGHDSPRDRNAPGRDWYATEQEGRIRSWRARFDCVDPGCQETRLPLQNVWQADVVRTSDPSGRQVFDDGLVVIIPLDTLCLAPECPPGSTALRVQLEAARFGAYDFTLQGRDTEAVHQNCLRPSDLGPDPAYFNLNIATLGLMTEEVRRRAVWRQLADVRPLRTLPARRTF